MQVPVCDGQFSVSKCAKAARLRKERKEVILLLRKCVESNP
jgi:hypothetical protein